MPSTCMANCTSAAFRGNHGAAARRTPGQRSRQHRSQNERARAGNERGKLGIPLRGGPRGGVLRAWGRHLHGPPPQNLCTYSPLKPLTQDEEKFLTDIANDIYNLKTIPCNECNYCMPCPYGIDIPAVLSHYNKWHKGRVIFRKWTSRQVDKQTSKMDLSTRLLVPRLLS